MEYEKIESPISAFNNIIYQFIVELNEIFEIESSDINNQKTSNFIFDNNSIIFFERIKVFYLNNKMQLMLLTPIHEKKMYILRTITNRFSDIANILYRYLYMLNSITNNYDLSISNGYINSIISDIKNKTYKDKYYSIPYKNKIFNEVETDKTVENLYNKFTYLLEFNNIDGNLQYNIVRCLSSDLDESKSIHNIKFLEKEKIANGIVSDIRKFLIKLMRYGEPN